LRDERVKIKNWEWCGLLDIKMAKREMGRDAAEGSCYFAEYCEMHQVSAGLGWSNEISGLEGRYA
jgi:hypothetical protein